MAPSSERAGPGRQRRVLERVRLGPPVLTAAADCLPDVRCAQAMLVEEADYRLRLREALDDSAQRRRLFRRCGRQRLVAAEELGRGQGLFPGERHPAEGEAAGHDADQVYAFGWKD